MIKLKKNADRRIRKGHLWVFSNEIGEPPVSELEPGSVHELQDAGGEFLGMVYANPASLITARILTRKKTPIDADFIMKRVEAALSFRKRVYRDGDLYRLVYGESDLLPGLVVDRYGPILAVQSLTAGMDRLLDPVLEALVYIVSPEGIYLRNDSPSRNLEQRPHEKRVAYGSVPDMVQIASDGLSFLVDVANGQKTGFFLDQQANRPIMRRYVPDGAKVLDLFCYSAAWGLHAAAAGAQEVTAVDSSRGALKLAVSNAALNGMEQRIVTVRDDVLDFLKKAHQSWDMVILDPPAFVKSRSTLQEGRKGYIDLNRRALGKLGSGGILITCSCSHHVDQVEFEALISAASQQSGRQLRILEVHSQGPDHPVLMAMRETRYLKLMVAQVI